MDANEKQYLKIMEEIHAGLPVSPLRAIRAKCLDCTCYQISEIEHCPCDCPLIPFRKGHSLFTRRAKEG